MTRNDQMLARAAHRLTPLAVIVLLSVLDIFRVVYLSGFSEDGEPLWRIWIYELSSGAMLLALIPFVAWISRRFPLHQLSAGMVAAHAAASVAFSFAHVAGMVAMRHAVFAILGDRYSFGPTLPGVAYEYGKDVFTYAIFLAVLSFGAWARRTILRRQEVDRLRAHGGISVQTARGTILVPFAALLRVEASGNYVTLVTAGGAFLHRATMREMAELLPPAEFARTHRSHIVRLGAILCIRSESNGDKALELRGGGKVPLSRAYARSRDWTLPFDPGPEALGSISGG